MIPLIPGRTRVAIGTDDDNLTGVYLGPAVNGDAAFACVLVDGMRRVGTRYERVDELAPTDVPVVETVSIDVIRPLAPRP